MIKFYDKKDRIAAESDKPVKPVYDGDHYEYGWFRGRTMEELPSAIRCWWLNMVQSELLSALTACGKTPNSTNDEQLGQCFDTKANLSGATFTGPVEFDNTATFDGDVIINNDIDVSSLSIIDLGTNAKLSCNNNITIDEAVYNGVKFYGESDFPTSVTIGYYAPFTCSSQAEFNDTVNFGTDEEINASAGIRIGVADGDTATSLNVSDTAALDCDGEAEFTNTVKFGSSTELDNNKGISVDRVNGSTAMILSNTATLDCDGKAKFNNTVEFGTDTELDSGDGISIGLVDGATALTCDGKATFNKEVNFKEDITINAIGTDSELLKMKLGYTTYITCYDGLVISGEENDSLGPDEYNTTVRTDSHAYLWVRGPAGFSRRPTFSAGATLNSYTYVGTDDSLGHLTINDNSEIICDGTAQFNGESNFYGKATFENEISIPNAYKFKSNAHTEFTNDVTCNYQLNCNGTSTYTNNIWVNGTPSRTSYMVLNEYTNLYCKNTAQFKNKVNFYGGIEFNSEYTDPHSVIIGYYDPLTCNSIATFTTEVNFGSSSELSDDKGISINRDGGSTAMILSDTSALDCKGEATFNNTVNFGTDDELSASDGISIGVVSGNTTTSLNVSDTARLISDGEAIFFDDVAFGKRGDLYELNGVVIGISGDDTTKSLTIGQDSFLYSKGVAEFTHVVKFGSSTELDNDEGISVERVGGSTAMILSDTATLDCDGEATFDNNVTFTSATEDDGNGGVNYLHSVDYYSPVSFFTGANFSGEPVSIMSDLTCTTVDVVNALTVGSSGTTTLGGTLDVPAQAAFTNASKFKNVVYFGTDTEITNSQGIKLHSGSGNTDLYIAGNSSLNCSGSAQFGGAVQFGTDSELTANNGVSVGIVGEDTTKSLTVETNSALYSKGPAVFSSSVIFDADDVANVKFDEDVFFVRTVSAFNGVAFAGSPVATPIMGKVMLDASSSWIIPITGFGESDICITRVTVYFTAHRSTTGIVIPAMNLMKATWDHNSPVEISSDVHAFPVSADVTTPFEIPVYNGYLEDGSSLSTCETDGTINNYYVLIGPDDSNDADFQYLGVQGVRVEYKRSRIFV